MFTCFHGKGWCLEKKTDKNNSSGRRHGAETEKEGLQSQYHDEHGDEYCSWPTTTAKTAGNWASVVGCSPPQGSHGGRQPLIERVLKLWDHNFLPTVTPDDFVHVSRVASSRVTRFCKILPPHFCSYVASVPMMMPGACLVYLCDGMALVHNPGCTGFAPLRRKGLFPLSPANGRYSCQVDGVTAPTCGPMCLVFGAGG